MLENYHVIELIGEGSFGKVSRVPGMSCGAGAFSPHACSLAWARVPTPDFDCVPQRGLHSCCLGADAP